MLKIIIVDDEYLFREALKVSIDFEGLGLEIVGEAKNGKEAIGLVESQKPDIALVDINMPIIDGLEFAKYINSKEIDTKIIIISGYDQFDYAKEAIHLGVQSYLLKPINEEELTNELKELMRSIEVERSISEEISVLKEQARTNVPFLKERLILDLLMGHFDTIDSTLVQKFEYLNITLPFKQYCVVIFELSLSEDDNEEMMEIHRITLHKLVDKLFGQGMKYQWTYDHKRRMCLIMDNDDHYSQDRLSAQLGSLIKVMKENNVAQPFIGISNSYSMFEYTHTAYNEAVSALNYSKSQNQNYSFYGTFSDKGLSLVVISKEQRNEILMNMRMGNTSEIMDALDGIFLRLRKIELHVNNIRYVFMELSSLCMELVSEVDDTDEVFGKWLKELFDESRYHQSIDALESWLKETILNVMSLIDDKKTNKSLALVNEIKKYVDQNFTRSDFSIDKIANALYVNYSHLCYTFKKETDTTINDYVVDKRLNHAVMLMNEGHTVIRSISELVGFSDSGYFSKSFKKHMGVTPSQYINSKV